MRIQGPGPQQPQPTEGKPAEAKPGASERAGATQQKPAPPGSNDVTKTMVSPLLQGDPKAFAKFARLDQQKTTQPAAPQAGAFAALAKNARVVDPGVLKGVVLTQAQVPQPKLASPQPTPEQHKALLEARAAAPQVAPQLADRLRAVTRALVTLAQHTAKMPEELAAQLRGLPDRGDLAANLKQAREHLSETDAKLSAETLANLAQERVFLDTEEELAGQEGALEEVDRLLADYLQEIRGAREVLRSWEVGGTPVAEAPWVRAGPEPYRTVAFDPVTGERSPRPLALGLPRAPAPTPVLTAEQKRALIVEHLAAERVQHAQDVVASLAPDEIVELALAAAEGAVHPNAALVLEPRRGEVLRALGLPSHAEALGDAELRAALQAMVNGFRRNHEVEGRRFGTYAAAKLLGTRWSLEGLAGMPAHLARTWPALRPGERVEAAERLTAALCAPCHEALYDAAAELFATLDEVEKKAFDSACGEQLRRASRGNLGHLARAARTRLAEVVKLLKTPGAAKAPARELEPWPAAAHARNTYELQTYIAELEREFVQLSSPREEHMTSMLNTITRRLAR